MYFLRTYKLQNQVKKFKTRMLVPYHSIPWLLR